MKSQKHIKKSLKKLSEHKPKKKNFYSDKNLFGHYLAGLIDGDGYFSTMGHCVISFSSKDESFARQLRTQIGYGTIIKIAAKKPFNLVISHPDGIKRVTSLVLNKLKHPIKIKQFNERVTKLYSIDLTSESSIIDWDTPWFSGFFDAEGNFVSELNKVKTEIRLLVQIDQKENVLLEQLKKKFSGYLGYKKTQDTYYYSSTSFSNVSIILQYFDKFSLQSPTKYLSYNCIRKAFLIVQEKKHLTEKGFEKIEAYQKRLFEIKNLKV